MDTPPLGVGRNKSLGKGSITANHRSASLTFPSHAVCVVQKEDLPLIFQCPLLDWRHRADFFFGGVYGITLIHKRPYLRKFIVP